MEQLPNNAENTKVFENEFISSTSLNRPLHRLVQNDIYLASIISNYMNRPVLPFQDYIAPPTLIEKVKEKEWVIGDIKKDRGLTFQYVLDDGSNFRHCTTKITYNNIKLEVSETFHETPHEIGLVEYSYYIDDEGLIKFKITTKNPKRLKIIGEIINNVPNEITNVLASRYEFYRNNMPELEGVHTHVNLDLLQTLRKDTQPDAEYEYLNAQGEYSPIRIKNPTSHNHINHSFLERIYENNTDNIDVINKLIGSGEGTKFLADNGEYIESAGLHVHMNKNLLDSLQSDGANNAFLNAQGNYSIIDVPAIHTHSNAAFLANIIDNGNNNAGAVNGLKIGDDSTMFYNLKGEYKQVPDHPNINVLNNIMSGGNPEFFLGQDGQYHNIPTVDLHKHDNKASLDLVGQRDKSEFLAGDGQFYEIEQAIPTGSILLDARITLPEGFIECNGQEVSRAFYFELFTEVGIEYGDGDGANTFNVPDLTPPDSKMR